MQGIGVGFGNQSIPIYISETAPANHRGAMNITFQLATTIGILAAQLLNFGMCKLASNTEHFKRCVNAVAAMGHCFGCGLDAAAAVYCSLPPAHCKRM